LSAVLQKYFLHYGQAKPCSVNLGGKEWPKELWQRFRGNPGAVVPVVNALNAVVGGIGCLATKNNDWIRRGADSRLCCVAGKVKKYLPKQSFIAGNFREIAFDNDSNLGLQFFYFTPDAVSSWRISTGSAEISRGRA
jgi:hypothetical protein